MSDLSLLLSQTRTVVTAQRASESATTIPPDADTMLILELGDRTDAISFHESMTRENRNPRVYNITPREKSGSTQPQRPTRKEDSLPPWYKKEVDEQWLDRFVAQSPHWLYISGHFGQRRRHPDPPNTTHLYNNPENFSCNFIDPTVDNNPLWRRFKEPPPSGFGLGARCRCVIMMGCRAIHPHPSFKQAVRNIQTMLTGPLGPPIVLGFYVKCPAHDDITSPLCRDFGDELNSKWSDRHDHAHIADSWLNAGRKWYVRPGGLRYARRLAFRDAKGDAFRVSDTLPFTWEVLY